uniref:Protein kinase domain-containing protein n=1 Tax=Tetradesmus obliquus TaxID=3088 RepID=A0A383VCB8_TETOB|eukprot:jgi/Sobl393_1/13697/SZX62821.1
MQPLSGIIALQECLLAALILVSLPGAPIQQSWTADTGCIVGALNQVAAHGATPGYTLPDVIVCVLISCLGGFLLGRHSAQAGVWQQQQLQQQRATWEPAAGPSSIACEQLMLYAALAWQQLRHVPLAVVAAGAKYAAVLLALLAAKASNAAAAVSDAAAAAAAHTHGQGLVQCLEAAGDDGSHSDDEDEAFASVETPHALASLSFDENVPELAAPSFATYLAQNKQQQPQSLQQQQQQQQQGSEALWQGLHSQLPASAAPAAAETSLLTVRSSSVSSRSSGSPACRIAAHDSIFFNKQPLGNHSKAGSSRSGSSGGSKSGVRSDSGPLPLSGRASANTVTPLGWGWTCVLSRSSPAVQAASSQPGSEQRQLRQEQQQQESGSSMAQQQAGENISLGVVLGCGAHGKVYKGQWRGQPVAVKVLYHSGLRAAARALHETDLMLQACHKNVVQTHHVLMWQRAKAVIDDECGGAAPPQQQGQQLLRTAFSGSASGAHDEAAAEPSAAAAAGGDDGSLQEGGRRYSSLHLDAAAGTATSACGVLELGAADSEAADGWLGVAGAADDDEDYLEAQTWIVQELCDGGPLDAAAKNGKFATMERMLSCLLDVARGLEYLHSKGLTHGDLKAGNVCLVSTQPAANHNSNAAAAAAAAAAEAASPAACNGNAEGGRSCRSSSSRNAEGVDFVCKVMDFSLSRALDAGKSHCSTQSLGTITHMAPELLLTGKQSKAADVYSMGMLIWEVVHGGTTPFRNCSHSMEVMQLVLAKQRPPWQPGSPPELIVLAEQCWAAEPAERPCISAVAEQLLQMQLALQLAALQHIDMQQSWPSGPWLQPTAAAASASAPLPGVLQPGGSSRSSSRRGSGASSGSTGAASFYGVAKAAAAAAAAAEAADNSSAAAAAAAAQAATSAAAAAGAVRQPVRKSVSFNNASPAAAALRGLQAIPEAVTPRANWARPAAAALPAAMRLPLSAGAVLQTCNGGSAGGGGYRTLDQVLAAGLNPSTGLGSSAAGSGADAGLAGPGRVQGGGFKQAAAVRRHSVPPVDHSSNSGSHQQRLQALQALRSNAADAAAAAVSTGADVSEMQAFDNVLVTGRKAFARGVDCSALDDVMGSQDAGKLSGKQSGSVWPVQQQQQQQQQQQWRLSGSGIDLAPNALSAGDALGPMVGYWD